MDRTELSDEILMAYADGELDADTSRAVAEAERDDPTVRARIALFSGTKSALAAAAQARPLDPVSSELADRVRQALAAETAEEPAEERVVPFAPRRSAAPAPVLMAIAASIALAVGLAGGHLLTRSSSDPADLGIASLDATGLSGVLDTAPSGEQVEIDDGEISMIMSFRNADGEICREFEHAPEDRATVLTVACRTADAWEPRFAMVIPSADASGYSPASSLETLDAYLGSIGAGAALSLEEEAAALATNSD